MVQRGRDTRLFNGATGGSKMSIILSLFLIIGPVAILYCGVMAIKHTIIIRNEKRKSKMSTALIASLWETNGPNRKYGVR